MAASLELTMSDELGIVLRAAAPELTELQSLVFSRYPRREWATFARFGWREIPGGLLLTLTGLDAPFAGELDAAVAHVAIMEPYTLRVALSAEHHSLAVGVIHSHPRGAAPIPSPIDDSMDGYYASYFGDFAPGRPYVSLILSEISGEVVLSGRVYWRGAWHRVNRVSTAPHPVMTWVDRNRVSGPAVRRERTARLDAAFGQEASQRLRRATVAVIGAGGTGSAAIEVLTRAGVGHLILVDPDHLEASNLERVHGSVPEDVSECLSKVAVARRHVRSIDPECDVIAIEGALPQSEVIDAVVTADVAIGCTDQQHSRLALGDLAVRYLVPAIDSAVALEGKEGRVSGQIIQLIRFLPADPCPLCRGMIAPARVAQELMSEDERSRRRSAAARARDEGLPAGGYWQDVPQLNTVGYLTTAAGALAAGYAIGWLTGRFGPPFTRVQLNLAAPLFDVVEVEQDARPDCLCRRSRGTADQGTVDALISPPSHWPPARIV
jgi:molybdopterin/thiamine biosynthesis adenylyltransferase